MVNKLHLIIDRSNAFHLQSIFSNIFNSIDCFSIHYINKTSNSILFS